jgi:hypothetical protein
MVFTAILSVTMFALPVNSLAAGKTMTLSNWIEKVRSEGKEMALGQMFDAPVGASAKRHTVEGNGSAEDKAHQIAVALDSTAKPMWLILSTQRWGLFENEREDCHFQTSLDGKLQKVVFGRIKIDKDYKAVSGSGLTESQDINSPRIKELFQKEMDFWLKGHHRKKLPSQKRQP